MSSVPSILWPLFATNLVEFHSETQVFPKIIFPTNRGLNMRAYGFFFLATQNSLESMGLCEDTRIYLMHLFTGLGFQFVTHFRIIIQVVCYGFWVQIFLYMKRSGKSIQPWELVTNAYHTISLCHWWRLWSSWDWSGTRRLHIFYHIHNFFWHFCGITTHFLPSRQLGVK